MKGSADLGRRSPRAVRRLVGLFGGPILGYFRADLRGVERIPDGPAILVANHGGGMSPADSVFFFAWCRARGADEPLYVLAHRWFTGWGPLRRALARLGIVRADPAIAAAALENGAKVLVYPGGDYDSLRPFSARSEVRFGGRTGFARLAAATGAPLVPVVTAGSHEVFVVLTQGRRLAAALGLPRVGLHSFPMVLCLPWGLLIGPLALLPFWPLPARVTVEVGEPLAAGTEADQVESAMTARLRLLMGERRWPVLG